MPRKQRSSPWAWGIRFRNSPNQRQLDHRSDTSNVLFRSATATASCAGVSGSVLQRCAVWLRSEYANRGDATYRLFARSRTVPARTDARRPRPRPEIAALTFGVGPSACFVKMKSAWQQPVLMSLQNRSCHEKCKSPRVNVIVRDGTYSINIGILNDFGSTFFSTSSDVCCN